MSTIRNYKYVCGANIYIKINDILVSEAAMIDWNLYQNKLPIYGYNAARFSNVADGQVIVKGNLILNHVSPNYLTALISASRADAPTIWQGEEGTKDDETEAQKIARLQKEIWGEPTINRSTEYNNSIHGKNGFLLRPDQHNETVTLSIYKNGVKEYDLQNLTFYGKSQTITNQNDGSVKEAYSFLARDIF